MKRFIAMLFVIFAVVTLSLAATGLRFAPKGTFKGNPATLLRIARNNGEVAKCYNQKLGKGWNQPGALKVLTETKVPDGALVPDNALLDRSGRLDYRDSYQRGADMAYLVENTISGQKAWIKSCGQPFTAEIKPNRKPQPIVEETDFELYVDIDISVRAEANATANARGGNATAIVNIAQARFVPQQRILSVTDRQGQLVAGIVWVVPVRINNVNNNCNSNVNNNANTNNNANSNTTVVNTGSGSASGSSSAGASGSSKAGSK